MIDPLAHKYAYSIADLAHNKVSQVGGINFDKMKIGFYEEIESQNDKLSNNRLYLQKLKTNSIKDYIYSNIAIPPIWRNKLSYQDEVLSVIHNDLNFLKYLGNTTPKSLSTSSSFTSILPKVYQQKKMQPNKSYENILNEKENQFSLKKSFSGNIEKNTDENLYKISSKPNESDPTKEDVASSTSNTKEQTLKQRSLIIKKKKPNEKDIKLLLEEFRNNHSFTKKFEEIINDKKDGNSFDIKNNTMKGVQRLKPKEKREIFNTSLYTKLLPKKPSYTYRHFSMPKENVFPRNELLNINESNSETNKNILTNRKFEIKNPIIRKNLESINYFGPRYSYCSLCRNRNIDFYNELQTSSCLSIIKSIKKMKSNK